MTVYADDRLERTKRLLMKEYGLTESEAEGWINQNKDQIEAMSDPSFDLWFWVSLIFGALSIASFLFRLFSGSRSERKRARVERREELIV